ncbi:hypothetical protein HDU89_005979 [Geranomyces variabilis]|nr:hypothetical protein HDU89_005979 [Geranomyces variabilis]
MPPIAKGFKKLSKYLHALGPRASPDVPARTAKIAKVCEFVRALALQDVKNVVRAAIYDRTSN